MPPAQPLDQALKQLLKHQQVWRASSMEQDPQRGIPTGHQVLDQYLPGKGWPIGGLTEILHDKPGIGEFRLLAPALSHLSQQQNRWLLWIAPPYIPYAPALARAGIDLTRVLIVNPESAIDTLWVLEKALASQSCSAVMAWPKKLSNKQLRRLQIASKEGHCLGLLYRPTSVSQHPSPAELRLQIFSHRYSQAEASPFNDHSVLQVQVLKRKGGWATDKFQIVLDDQLNQFTPDFRELTVKQRNQQTLITEYSIYTTNSSGYALQ